MAIDMALSPRSDLSLDFGPARGATVRIYGLDRHGLMVVCNGGFRFRMDGRRGRKSMIRELAVATRVDGADGATDQ